MKFKYSLSHIHWNYFRRLDHPQGSTRYPFLLLCHIEDNVYFKFGRVCNTPNNILVVYYSLGYNIIKFFFFLEIEVLIKGKLVICKMRTQRSCHKKMKN